MDSPYTGQSAPYGQACMQCFKAKSKCILRESGDKCERLVRSYLDVSYVVVQLCNVPRNFRPDMYNIIDVIA